MLGPDLLVLQMSLHMKPKLLKQKPVQLKVPFERGGERLGPDGSLVR